MAVTDAVTDGLGADMIMNGEIIGGTETSEIADGQE